MLRFLLDILNDFFSSGVFPNQWNEFLIAFIPKANSNKARPIALASCLLKLLEKLIIHRLTWYLENNELLSKYQFGFRKGKSCIDNLAILINCIQKAFYENNSLAALFLDIKGAFDNVVPDLLLKDLAELKLPKEYLTFFESLIKKRKLIPLGVEAEEQATDLGLPQGTMSSPVLFSIYTKDMPKVLKNRVKMLKFADYFTIFITDLDIKNMLKIL